RSTPSRTRPHRGPPHFPYTTLFRSRKIVERRAPVVCSLVALDRAVADLGKFSVRPAVVELCKSDRAGNRVRIVVIGRERFPARRSEEHTSELQSRFDLVCRLLLEKK